MPIQIDDYIEKEYRKIPNIESLKKKVYDKPGSMAPYVFLVD